MKSIVTSVISNEKQVPNIPAQKNALKKLLNENEIKYANTVADHFLLSTLVTKSFFNECSSSNEPSVTRIFSVLTENLDVKKEMVEYAALLIYGDIFIKEKCPDILEVTLSYTGTEDLQEDPVPPMYWGDKISDMYVITLASKA